MARQDAKGTGSAATGRAAGSRRRKASRPPVIDLEAVEVASKTAKGRPSSPEKAAGTPDSGEAAEPTGAARPERATRKAAKPAAKDTAPPSGKTGGGIGRDDKPPGRPAGFGHLLLAAGAGALIFLIAFLALRLTGQNMPSGNDALTASLDRLGAKIDQLERNATRGGAAQGSLAGGDVQRVAAEARAAKDAAAAASRRIADLEARIDTLTKAAASAPRGEQIIGLAGRLETLETSSAALRQDLAAALAKQGDLETALTSAKGAGGRVPAALALRLKDQAVKLARLEREVRAAKSATTAAGHKVTGKLADADRKVANVTARMDRLDKQLAALAATVDSLSARREADARFATKIAAVEKNLASLGKTRLAVAALLVARLESAVRSGTRFGDDLALLRALAPDLQSLDALAPHAARGVPSRAALSAGFAAVAGKLGARSGGDVSSLMDRLVARASTIVTVRKGDQVVIGSPASGPAGRIAARLRAGDLPGAYDAGRALDAEDRKIAQGWLDDLADAVAAERALSEIRTRVRAGLAGQRETAPAGNGKAD